LTAATLTGSLKKGSNLFSESGTASIAPAGICCIRRPRADTNFSASSREKTPARHAATYSPML
jgi:hypothetical protein